MNENNYEMLLVINCFRPLTSNVQDTLEVMHEIEYAAGMKFTAIVNNSNLAGETTAETVLSSVEYAKAVSDAAGIPIKMTTVFEHLYPSLEGKIDDLFPLRLQEKLI